MPSRRGEESRAAVRDAALRLFSDVGYAATVRDIARAAGVDPAIVIRHSGSKEALFLEAMQLDESELLRLDGPLEDLGADIVRHVLRLDSQTRNTFLALMRASQTGGVGTALRELHDAAFIRPLRSRLTGHDTDMRARFAAALVGGLMYSLWIVEDDALSARHDEVIDRYGHMLQLLITPESNTASPPGATPTQGEE